MVGRDGKLNFWYGNWTKLGPLRQLIQGPLPREAPSWEVKDVILDTRWDWSNMPFVYPPEIKLMLQATLIPLIGRGSDKIAWMHNPRGDFDLKECL